MQKWRMQQIPEHIAQQVAHMMHSLRMILGDDISVVLHGSVALGDYQPRRSDVDVIVVVRQPLSVSQLREMTELLLAISCQPAPIEISVLDGALCDAWTHPAPFYFHYSEEWRDALTHALGDASYVWDVVRHDPDLSVHMVIAHHHGIVLYGDVQLPLPTASQALAAVWYDIAQAETQVLEHPDYVILNLCRTMRWLAHGEVHSKGSGGVAMLATVTGQVHDVIACMVAMRRGESVTLPDPPVLQRVARQLLMQIQRHM